MEKDTKTFELKINGEVIFKLEANGTKDIVDAFEKKCMTGSWGIFEDWNKTIGKLILNEIEVKMSTIFRDKKGHGLTCPLYVASKNPMEEDNNQKCVEGLESMGLFNRENFIPSKNPMEEECVCGEQTTFGDADVEIGGICHRTKNPCYVISPHQSNQEDKSKECEQGNHDICTSPTCPLYPSKDIEDLENGRVLEKWNNQEDKSILKNIDYNVGTYEKIVEPIQEDKDWEDGIKSKIFNIVAKLDNGSHSSNQLQGIDEALFELIKKTKQESYEEGKAKANEEYAKQNDGVLGRNIEYIKGVIADVRLEERNRIIELVENLGTVNWGNGEYISNLSIIKSDIIRRLYQLT